MKSLKMFLIIICLVCSLHLVISQHEDCTNVTTADIVFLIDGSSSIGTSNFEHAKKFMQKIVENLDVGQGKIQIGVAQYSSDTYEEFLLNSISSKQEILSAIQNMRYRQGGSNMGKALGFILTNYFTKSSGSRLEEKVVPQIVILLTDGESSDNVTKEAQALRNKGIKIYAIGVNIENVKELQKVASRPFKKFIFNIESYGVLQKVMSGILGTICSAVRAELQALSTEFADVVFLVDSSDRIQRSGFQQAKSIISKTINKLEIGPNAFRIGLAQYSRDAKVEFLFNTYQRVEQMLNHINKKLIYSGGPLNTGKAIRFLNSTFFQDSAGSRINEGYPQYAVIITSDKSEDNVQLAAKELKSRGVRVIVAGVKKFDHTEFENTVQLIYKASDTRGMDQINENITNVILKPLEADKFSPPECAHASVADIVFLVDQSTSIGKKNFQQIRHFLHEMVEALDVHVDKVRIGMALYSTKAEVEFDLNAFNEKDDVLQYIKTLPYRGGGTNTGAALDFIRTRLFTETAGSRIANGIKQIAIVITDGKSQDNVSVPATNLRRLGVTVYAVGIQNANEQELNYIASYPMRDHVSILSNFLQLHYLKEHIVKEICRTIIEEAFSPMLSVNLREECIETEEADIYFLVDGSGSIYPQDFSDMKKFMNGVIDMFNIGAKKIRVGVVQYADIQLREFAIDQYVVKSDIKDAIKNIRQRGYGTQTGKALNFMQPLFKDAAKSRNANVSQILITITDGKSQDNVSKPAASLRNMGIKVYAIGIRDAVDAELLDIAGEAKRRFYVHNFDSLDIIKKDVVKEICSEGVCKKMEGDVIFLMDGSESINAKDFTYMMKFAQSLVNKFDIGEDRVKVGLIQFSDETKAEFELRPNKPEILQAINEIQQMQSGTKTGRALSFVSEYFESNRGGRPDLSQNLIVVTDGESRDEVVKPAKALRQKGINIFAIGVAKANTTQLEEISGNKAKVFYQGNFEGLKYLERDILLGICRSDEICKRAEVADIIFVVDTSTSITPEEFVTMKRFMESVVNDTEVGENKVKFGAVLYSDSPKVSFTLRDFTSKSQVREAILNLEQQRGSTYTAAALNYTKQYFGMQYGGRKQRNIPQILMVITDGEATDKYDVPAVSRSVREAGINIYAVGVREANQDELEIMAGAKEKVFYVKDFKKLSEIHKNITNLICNQSRPGCDIEVADIVVLLDSSGSISKTNFDIMKNFTKQVINSFEIGQNRVHMGVCQYSTNPKKEVYLNEIYEKKNLYNKINNIIPLKQNTLTGSALKYVATFFDPQQGGRSMSVPKFLLVITDGVSQDQVSTPAAELRNKGVNIFSVGVGKANIFELIQIAGTSKQVLKVETYSDLDNIKRRIVRNICDKPDCDSHECSVDILIGFDISKRTKVSVLFDGQRKLQLYLPQILKKASSLSSITCSGGSRPKVRFSFLVLGEGANTIFSSPYDAYYEDALQRLMSFQTSETSYLNIQSLQVYLENLNSTATAKVKALLMFSDGLDDPVNQLWNIINSYNHERQGKAISALETVALEGATNIKEIQLIEFGIGFKYRIPRSIEIQDFPDIFLNELDAITEKKCCNVYCKCTGESGNLGSPGSPGDKGDIGLRGSPGHPGDEGTSGSRGPPGFNGTQGIQGCQGRRGVKGARGFIGDKGSSGEAGLHGIAGEEGGTGSPGSPGEKGELGRRGQRGTRGELGERGETGIRGDPGSPGRNSIVRGPKGSKGNAGRQGDPGDEGVHGDTGKTGSAGSPGRRGRPGLKGEKGVRGGTGPRGEPGLHGRPGENGVTGFPGAKGAPGPHGIQGDPGPTGAKGNSGRLGPIGLKGEQGEPGEMGEQGLTGNYGLPGIDGRDGYGIPGKKGIKGQIGFPGIGGPQGDDGDSGSPGSKGAKGNRGRRGNSGLPGENGSPGTLGPNGPRGPKGQAGKLDMKPCDLVKFVRNNCPCCQGAQRCPAFPTEVVFALDMSNDVQTKQFLRMKSIMQTLVTDLQISESNCPTGARVSVVSYNTNTKHIIRFSEYNKKVKLLEAIKKIPLERTSVRRSIGTAMRFIGRNIFKRVRQGFFTRKIAIFFANEDSPDLDEMNTAVLEYNAMDIIPVVIALNDVQNIRQAFEVDDTGKFRVFVLTDDTEGMLNIIRSCTLCYDPCTKDEECEAPHRLVEMDMDLAIVLDSSRNIRSSQFETAKGLIRRIIDQLSISSQPQTSPKGSRLALVQHSPLRYFPGRGQVPVQKEFDFITFTKRIHMQEHLERVQHLQGSSAVGHAIEWTINNVFKQVPNPRKLKVIFVVLGGKTVPWDQKRMTEISLYSKCLGFSVFTVALGMDISNSELTGLSSSPLDQHFIHLGAVMEPDIQFADKFIRAFFNLLKSKCILSKELRIQ
ncbi:collagen alpha-6(VI) chain-like [Protopterus annectens]|uniref:collagen alpha-6(VI) chain-like n=1 Tax=Protopterus annectens TaxID=7888 RepID=UPI001CFA22C0|nr:collagen alpha-6(VI) chain-like [Protopterus annectens]